MTSSAQSPGWLERRFKLRERGTTVRIEAMAGATTFLAAVYLVVVIPGLLASGGIDRGAATTAVIVSLALGSTFMAFYGNLPFLVGPGIGGSAIVGVTLAQQEHIPWPEGIAIALIAGALFFLLTVLKLREVVTRTVPKQIKLGLGASIGLFIVLLGFRNGGLVVANAKTNAFALGDFTAPGALVALIGLVAAIFFQARKIPGGILWAILLATLAGLPLGVTKFGGQIISLPHSLGPVFWKFDLTGALTVAALPYVFAFFAAEFFSTMGTTLAVGESAGLVDAEGNMKDINKPFVVDSVAATCGTFIGVPAITALVESAAGVGVGGRTGLTALVAGGLFLLVLFFMPIALMIPKEATAPALILIGLHMFGSLRHANLGDFSDGLAVLLMVMFTLVSNSFGTGIAGGLLAYVVIKVLAGRGREVPFGLYVLAVPLAYYFWTVVGPARH